MRGSGNILKITPLEIIAPYLSIIWRRREGGEERSRTVFGMGGDGERVGDYERYVPEGGGHRKPNVIDRISDNFYSVLDGPTTWFRSKAKTTHPNSNSLDKNIIFRI